MSQVSHDSIDPKMLENLDLLLSMDVLESEEDWEEIEAIDPLKEDITEDEDFDET